MSANRCSKCGEEAFLIRKASRCNTCSTILMAENEDIIAMRKKCKCILEPEILDVRVMYKCKSCSEVFEKESTEFHTKN